MNGYVQTRCPRCGNAAWGHPAQATPCSTCGQPVPPMGAAQAPMPAPMAPQGWGAVPGMGGAPGMPGMGAPGMGMGAAPGMGAPGMPGMGAPGMGMAPGMGAAPGMPGMGTPPGMQVGAGQANPWSSPPVSTQATPQKMGIPLPGGFKLPFNITGKGGGISYFKIIGGVLLVIALGVGGLIFKMKYVTPKGMMSYASLSLEKGKPDADKMITQLAGIAKKWKKDAIFWSSNFQAVRSDGTVDVSKGAEVVYTSPSASGSYAKSQRSDSVKKYSFNPSGVNGKGKWGWNDPIKDMEAHPTPKCGIKDVVALLVKDGFGPGKTVRITFDPKFADYYAWRVIGEDPKIDALYAWEDCSLIK